MATESSKSSSSSADSYIGSLISLTSKSEIRYEGILYNINTEESSIGLRNVRSFGTEGRKKDGPQVMPGDSVYEYILFRGSDIKDLQVKSSPPVQPTQQINNDPAIIQSHYPRPPPTSSSFPTAASNPLPDPSIQNTQLGPPLYPPGGNPNPGSWAPMPPPPNPNMYWPGFYAPPNGLPQLHQQPLLRPPSGLYPNYNASLPSGAPILPEYPSPLLTTSTSSSYTTSTATDTLPSLTQIKPPNVMNSTEVNVTSNKPNVPSEVNLHYPSLVTPGQLLQPGQTAVVSSQFTQTVHKDVEVVQVSPTQSSEPPAPTEAQPPILPLPPQPRIAPKTNGASYQNRHNYNYRGRERGRGYGGSRAVTKFTEEFDFDAMNEKFNKDEIWGTLGKTNKSGTDENDGNASDEDKYEDENDADADLPKPVYSKDDFFDTLSCNTLDNQSNKGRSRFSEQMKLDTETFGEFSRYRGGRGGRGPYRGGRSRGRYGYGGRGRGGRTPNPTRDY